MLTERIGIIHEPVELLGPQLFSLILQILVILREVEGIIFIQIQWSRQKTIALRIRLLEFIVFLDADVSSNNGFQPLDPRDSIPAKSHSLDRSDNP